METKQISVEDLAQMKKDIELIKNMLMSEGELSDWAEKELAEARKEGSVSLEESEKRIFEK